MKISIRILVGAVSVIVQIAPGGSTWTDDWMSF